MNLTEKEKYSQVNNPEEELLNILQKELQEEIDREILEKLKETYIYEINRPRENQRNTK